MTMPGFASDETLAEEGRAPWPSLSDPESNSLSMPPKDFDDFVSNSLLDKDRKDSPTFKRSFQVADKGHRPKISAWIEPPSCLLCSVQKY